ncbi:MAG TPA: FecR domain-containing protein, partial [Candidatus Sulfotelmatobacter sp.]|nr:FecR domain-containing protein [Candidatus Sulfotelmatobacter sp.]
MSPPSAASGPGSAAAHTPTATQVAQLSSEAIGRVETVQGTVTATHPDGSTKVLAFGDPVFLNDTLESQHGSAVGLVFADKTSFVLGEAGRIHLDDMVYRQGSTDGHLAVSVLKGLFGFATGEIATLHNDAMSVRTPVGTIGIRGTVVAGNITTDGSDSTITLLEDPRGLKSAVIVGNAAGTQFLTHPNETIKIASFFSAPSDPSITTAPQGIDGVHQALLGIMPHTQPGAAAVPGGPNGGASHAASAVDPSALAHAMHGMISGSPYVDPTSATTDPRLTVPAFETSVTQTAVPPAAQVVLQEPFLTLGRNHLLNYSGYVDGMTVANSLKSGDVIEGSASTQNSLGALFTTHFDINKTLVVDNVETITFVVGANASGTINAAGIDAAPGGTVMKFLGTGSFVLKNAQNMTIDVSAFHGSYTLDLGANDTVITSADATGTEHLTLTAPITDQSLTLDGSNTKLTLVNGVNSGSFENIDRIAMSSGPLANVLTVVNRQVGTEFDGSGRPDDSLNLAAGGNTVTVNGIQTVTASAGDDAITYKSTIGGVSVDLNGAGNTVDLASGVNSGNFINVQRIDLDGCAPSTLALLDTQNGTTIHGNAAGLDTVILANGANSLDLTNIQTVELSGGAAANTLTVLNNQSGLVVDGSGRPDDALVLAGGGASSVTVVGIESITGVSGNETVTLAAPANGAVIDLGSGHDNSLQLAAGSSVNVAGVETVTGAGNDTVTLTEPPANGLTIDLGGGANRLQITGSGSIDVANVETITGGSGHDTVVLTAPVSGATIDLGGRHDSLQLAAGSSVNVAHVGTITGAGDDTVTLTAATTHETIDLGGGASSLALAAGSSASVANVETVTGAGDDSVTLTVAATHETIDLGGGASSLTLAAGSSVNVANVEAITGAGNDTVALTEPATNTTVDLGGGASSVELAAGSSVNVAGVAAVTGAGDDTVTLTE